MVAKKKKASKKKSTKKKTAKKKNIKSKKVGKKRSTKKKVAKKATYARNSGTFGYVNRSNIIKKRLGIEEKKNSNIDSEIYVNKKRFITTLLGFSLLEKSDLYVMLGILLSKDVPLMDSVFRKDPASEIKKYGAGELLLLRSDGKELIENIKNSRNFRDKFCEYFNICILSETALNPLDLYRKILEAIFGDLRKGDSKKLIGLFQALPLAGVTFFSMKQVGLVLALIVILVYLKNLSEDLCDCDEEES